MRAMMKSVREPSEKSFAEAEGRVWDSVTSWNHPATMLENPAALGSIRRIFENTLNSTSSLGWKPEAVDLAPVMRPLDGQSIPPSPLHDL